MNDISADQKRMGPSQFPSFQSSFDSS